MTNKKEELIRNLTQTISKESENVDRGKNDLIEKLQKILDKVKKKSYSLIKFLLIQSFSNGGVTF